MWLMKTLLTSRCINQRGAGHRQFYAVVGERIISSPILSENKGNLAAYHSGAAYFMRKDSFGVIYDDFGYVFDECEKVA